MENIATCRRQIEVLRHRAGEQTDTLAALKEVFALEAEHLRRHDQAQRLRDLRSKVMEEVEYVQEIESSAHYALNKVTLTIGLVKFALGALGAAARGSREHPISAGARLAKGDFGRDEPYGTVRVAVGPGGLSDRVNVVSVSQLSRESGKPEADIEAALKARGYLLMTPQTFSRVAEELEDKVLRGILALPVATASLRLKPANGDFG